MGNSMAAICPLFLVLMAGLGNLAGLRYGLGRLDAFSVGSYMHGNQ